MHRYTEDNVGNAQSTDQDVDVDECQNGLHLLD